MFSDKMYAEIAKAMRELKTMTSIPYAEKTEKEIGPEFQFWPIFWKKNHNPLVAIFEAKGLLIS